MNPVGVAFAPGTEGTPVRKKGLEPGRPEFISELFLLPAMTLSKLLNIPLHLILPIWRMGYGENYTRQDRSAPQVMPGVQ